MKEKKTLATRSCDNFRCLISRPQILNPRSCIQIRGKLLLYRTLLYFRGSQFSHLRFYTIMFLSPLLVIKKGLKIIIILSKYQQCSLPLKRAWRRHSPNLKQWYLRMCLCPKYRNLRYYLEVSVIVHTNKQHSTKNKGKLHFALMCVLGKLQSAVVKDVRPRQLITCNINLAYQTSHSRLYYKYHAPM